jgi:hypothetical protein
MRNILPTERPAPTPRILSGAVINILKYIANHAKAKSPDTF